MDKTEPENRREQKERRRGDRARIQIWAEEKQGDSRYFHLLSNLSSGGFFIEKQLPFPVGSMVDLEIELPDMPEKVQIKGLVVNNYQDPDSKNLGAGVKFIDLNSAAKKRIKQFLKTHWNS